MVVSSNGGEVHNFKGEHFATFPERLITPFVLAGCPKGGTVLDPFSGSGTTGVVASRFGREYIGIDISQKYVDLANGRMSAPITQDMFG